MMQTSEFRSMGSRIFLAMDGEPPQAPDLLTQVPGWFQQAEKIFSRFDPESELSRLNQSQGRPFHASAELSEVLNLARQTREMTRGLVTPTVLDALVQAGYGDDFSSLQLSGPSASATQSGLPPDALAFEFDLNSQTITLPPGVHLDLGGYAKGWMAHRAMTRLSRLAPVLVNAGGDIAVSGPRVNGDPWLIGIENPLRPKENIALVNVTEGGIATSGKDYRRWMKNGRLMHHLINPWTGEPAVSDVFSATVLASDVILAEAAAKLVVIAGSVFGCTWLEAHGGLAYLLQMEDGTTKTNQALEKLLWKPNETLVE
jgi:thiamine biosynthesis lipoprotein